LEAAHVKRLFLLRHAKSSWKDPSLPDRERPLAGRGRRATKAMATYLREHRIAPELVLCSSAVRAEQTLERVRSGLGESPEVKIEERLYEASERGLLECLREVPEEVSSVMMIGHNPAIERLALELANSGQELESLARKFPTGALATLELPGSWRELEPDGAQLVGFIRPKDLE
jgi:phosphohistidine phosphatase